MFLDSLLYPTTFLLYLLILFLFPISLRWASKSALNSFLIVFIDPIWSNLTSTTYAHKINSMHPVLLPYFFFFLPAKYFFAQSS